MRSAPVAAPQPPPALPLEAFRLRSTILVPVLCVLALTLPVALAGWSSKGAFEPDTKYDSTTGWMFTAPDVNPSQTVNKVYLNGYLAPSNLFYSSFNANVATLGSAAYPAPPWGANALFGVWKDCNKDGVIGLGDQGLIEYRAELLLDTSVCPKQTTPSEGAAKLPPLDWFPSHNDGQWVREYLPFAGRTIDVNGHDTNPWNVNADGTRAWFDNGLPGPAPLGGAACSIDWYNMGALGSTGSLLEFTDCLNGDTVTATFDSVADANAATQPYSFSDAPHHQGASGSALNKPDPWGRAADPSFASAWDCNAPQVHQVQVRNNQLVNVSAPRIPPGVSTSGSASGTMNSLGSGTDACYPSDQPTNDYIYGPSTGIVVATLIYGQQPHLGRDLADLPYRENPGNVHIPPTGKTGTTDMGPGYGGYLQSNRPAVPIASLLGKATPPDLGARVVDNDGIWEGGFSRDAQPLLDRGSLVPKPAGVQFVTYYGFVDATTISKYALTLPARGATGPGNYGAEACAGATTGTVNGWDCDKTHWGSGNKVGDLYNMRDIDCYDDSVTVARASGIGLGTLTGTGCPVPP